jgi:hypothetical protein
VQMAAFARGRLLRHGYGAAVGSIVPGFVAMVASALSCAGVSRLRDHKEYRTQ